MNIMVLEDDPYAMEVIGYLRDLGYEVWHAQGLLDVAYFLEEAPGVDNFSKLMFDAAVEGVPHSFSESSKFKYSSKDKFSGLKFVIENYDILKSKSIAVITAFNKEIYRDMFKDERSKKILNQLVIIDKSSDNFMAQLLSFISDNEEDHV